jgi:hypothetical protein
MTAHRQGNTAKRKYLRRTDFSILMGGVVGLADSIGLLRGKGIHEGRVV